MWQGQLENMLTESNLGLAAGVHVYYQHTNKSDPTSPLEDPTPHIAAFMVMRQEYWYFVRTRLMHRQNAKESKWVNRKRHVLSLSIYSCVVWCRYFFGSTGWLDGDWQWSALYDTLSQCGAPVDKQAHGDGTVYTRKYANCTAKVDCTNKTACTASIVGPNGAPLDLSSSAQLTIDGP